MVPFFLIQQQKYINDILPDFDVELQGDNYDSEHKRIILYNDYSQFDLNISSTLENPSLYDELKYFFVPYGENARLVYDDLIVVTDNTITFKHITLSTYPFICIFLSYGEIFKEGFNKNSSPLQVAMEINEV